MGKGRSSNLFFLLFMTNMLEIYRMKIEERVWLKPMPISNTMTLNLRAENLIYNLIYNQMGLFEPEGMDIKIKRRDDEIYITLNTKEIHIINGINPKIAAVVLLRFWLRGKHSTRVSENAVRLRSLNGLFNHSRINPMPYVQNNYHKLDLVDRWNINSEIYDAVCRGRPYQKEMIDFLEQCIQYECDPDAVSQILQIFNNFGDANSIPFLQKINPAVLNLEDSGAFPIEYLLDSAIENIKLKN
jgi:hypothetical protein